MQRGLVSVLGDSSFTTLHLILPIGMSFWTFMTISYLVDVSKGTTEVERTLVTVGFAIQIYCDFSGYTDIVRDSARILGFDLLPNFNRPYFSRSVKKFWQRWHMSLMGWLKVYVYFPLGGSRVPAWRRYRNIFIVFAVSGIWHGAGLSFLAWGLLNAFYQVFGEISAPVRARKARAKQK